MKDIVSVRDLTVMYLCLEWLRVSIAPLQSVALVSRTTRIRWTDARGESVKANIMMV